MFKDIFCVLQKLFCIVRNVICVDWFDFTLKYGDEKREKEEREDLGAF